MLQGTVLGPLMFLLYINDIANKVSSFIYLFADNYILITQSENESIIIQKDLNILSQ